ncbi:hypothetical protein O988_07355 [Pseudogymnoascus sp. VKM F-3808]|nr:hypothetical protein O988_07355 [Pseudogymnoascus sp. VKM F-3808]
MGLPSQRPISATVAVVLVTQHRSYSAVHDMSRDETQQTLSGKSCETKTASSTVYLHSTSYPATRPVYYLSPVSRPYPVPGRGLHSSALDTLLYIQPKYPSMGNRKRRAVIS